MYAEEIGLVSKNICLLAGGTEKKDKHSGDGGMFHDYVGVSYRIFYPHSEALLKMMFKLENDSNIAKVT